MSQPGISPVLITTFYGFAGTLGGFTILGTTVAVFEYSQYYYPS